MTPYSAGDIVLVRFPFTDLKSTKKRPALVLSPPEYQAREHDVVLLALRASGRDAAMRRHNSRGTGISVIYFGPGGFLLE